MIAGATVYVLDDDASFVRSTLRLLAAWGLAGRGFTSADAFLSHDLAGAPACLLLDLGLAGGSGLQVQRALATAPRSVPVVFVSGRADPEARAAAMGAGAIEFLPKPVDERSLLDAIRRALALDAAARAHRDAGGETRGSGD